MAAACSRLKVIRTRQGETLLDVIRSLLDVLVHRQGQYLLEILRDFSSHTLLRKVLDSVLHILDNGLDLWEVNYLTWACEGVLVLS